MLGPCSPWPPLAIILDLADDIVVVLVAVLKNDMTLA